MPHQSITTARMGICCKKNELTEETLTVPGQWPVICIRRTDGNVTPQVWVHDKSNPINHCQGNGTLPQAKLPRSRHWVHTYGRLTYCALIATVTNGTKRPSNMYREVRVLGFLVSPQPFFFPYLVRLTNRHDDHKSGLRINLTPARNSVLRVQYEYGTLPVTATSRTPGPISDNAQRGRHFRQSDSEIDVKLRSRTTGGLVTTIPSSKGKKIEVWAWPCKAEGQQISRIGDTVECRTEISQGCSSLLIQSFFSTAMSGHRAQFISLPRKRFQKGPGSSRMRICGACLLDTLTKNWMHDRRTKKKGKEKKKFAHFPPDIVGDAGMEN
ncbi:hypothetical protein F5888DRAFT_1638191 [Russula emetica]|nr:hypothetical protein F5888DRAFT_1638191 [Russula emetica]